jgi:transcriptional regulator with XRE-family HTH domain
METNQMIGEIIAKRRKELSLTQPDLAEYCGISERSLLAIEKSTGNPTLKQIGKVFGVLGLQLTVKAING